MFGTVQAQPAGDAPAELGAGAEAKLSPQEMTARTNEILTNMENVLRRVLELQQSARKQKDIIKLNCVNDKLLQVKQLLNIAEGAKADLIEAIAAQNQGDRYHRFAQITVASDQTNALRDEAEACIGEELIFLGSSEVEVDKPPIVDDPTTDDPFNLAGFGIERPTYATPYR
jgi:hypothetical protein